MPRTPTGRGKRPSRDRAKKPTRAKTSPARGRSSEKAARPAAPERPRPPRRLFEAVPTIAEAAPRKGDWLYTTRPGVERDLIEELFYRDARSAPRRAGPSLVAAASRPSELAFARQGLPVGELCEAEAIAPLLARLLAVPPSSRSPRSTAPAPPSPWAFDLWVPDTEETNRWSARARAIEEHVLGALAKLAPEWAQARVADGRAALAENGLYAQACLYAPERAALGVLPARDALSLSPGGRLRVHVPKAAPSRAAMKLLEAFAWLDRAPEPGDLCADLGAAPGGWSWVLLERRARVLAIDPARLASSVAGRRGLTHVRGDAFRFEPPEPVDWLFCDMAWRPLEAAALLAKWARRGMARLLVANIKLPMRKKAEHLLRVREILDDGGWRNLRVRQLYHDRDEVTFAGVRI